MKTKIIAVFSLLAVALFISVPTGSAQDRITRRTFPTVSFNVIDANTVGNIVFTQSPTTSVTAEGDEEMIRLLQVSVKNNELGISMKDKKWRLNRRRNTKLEIRVNSPHITEFKNRGVGNVTLKGKVQTPELKMASDGVGNIYATNLDCHSVVISSDGVGNIHLGGKTDFLAISSNGVGNVKAEELTARTAEISSDGVGNVHLYATESINIEAGGIGNVTYYGNPAKKQISKKGIGKVKAGD